MRKICPVHGAEEVLLSKDASRYADTPFRSAGKKLAVFQTKKSKGCPADCGICPEHEQHLCSALIEITDACDLRCPVCYHGDFRSSHITFDDFKERIALLLSAEGGRLDVLQISGGEPTLHPQFSEFLAYACAQDVGRVLVNTNGLHVRDERILAALSAHKDRAEIYLQFDGFDRDLCVAMRGEDLVDRRISAIETLNNAGIKICLAVTVAERNLAELDAILRYAAGIEHVSGITFQRFVKTGFGEKFDGGSVVHEDILRAVSSGGVLTYGDLFPLPCSHEHCTSVGFLLVDNGVMHAASKYLDFEKHIDLLKDKIAFEAGILKQVKERQVCACCLPLIEKKFPLIGRLQRLAEHGVSSYDGIKVLRIVVKNFMDAHTFDSDRARKCCIGVAVGQGKIIPFCVNNITRGKRRDR